jgi:hypothetical protein
MPQIVTPRVDLFSGNSSTTQFVLTEQAVAPQDILVVVNNVTQRPSVAYTANTVSNQITFVAAPATGNNNITVYYGTNQFQSYAPAEQIEIGGFNSLQATILSESLALSVALG